MCLARSGRTVEDKPTGRCLSIGQSGIQGNAEEVGVVGINPFLIDGLEVEALHMPQVAVKPKPSQSVVFEPLLLAHARLRLAEVWVPHRHTWGQPATVIACRTGRRLRLIRRFGCRPVGRRRALCLTLCLDAPQDTA